jgi:hypothetical protein
MRFDIIWWDGGELDELLLHHEVNGCLLHEPSFEKLVSYPTQFLQVIAAVHNPSQSVQLKLLAQVQFQILVARLNRESRV